MERLKGLKKQNKWMIPIAVVVFCVVAGFTHTSQVRAAEEKDSVDLYYLDPFDLTVTLMSVIEVPLVSDTSASTTTTTESASSPYVPPTKIWIPYRPTFRSPCVPSW